MTVGGLSEVHVNVSILETHLIPTIDRRANRDNIVLIRPYQLMRKGYERR
jgi:hypothetical protein